MSIEVINARFLKPLDEEMLHDVMKRNIPILTIEESVLQGGFGSSILEFAEENQYHPTIKRMGIPDRFIEHGSVQQLLEEIHLTKEQVIEELTNMLQMDDNKQKKGLIING